MMPKKSNAGSTTVPIPPVTGLVPRSYNLISRCVEDGISYGYQRAFKHTASPGEAHIKESIYDAVTNEISEWFNFPEQEE